MRGKRKTTPGVTRTTGDVDEALQIVADALDDGGVGFIQIEKANGAQFVRLMRTPPVFDARDDE